nr:MAG TPA: Interleukin 17 receptor D [Caudoviricetes sp.]
MRRRYPACHNAIGLVFRLTGYSGARPRRHRLQAYRARRAVAAAPAGVREQMPVFPGCQNRCRRAVP